MLMRAAGFTAAPGLQSLLKNKLQGVTRGYLVYLRMVGIGYRASLEGQVHSAICVSKHMCSNTSTSLAQLLSFLTCAKCSLK